MINDWKLFGDELLKLLAVHNGRICEERWHHFLKNYFTKAKAQKLRSIALADLDWFKQHDPASKAYDHAQILSVRRGMVAIFAHRIFQSILAEDNSAAALFEIELIAKAIQACTNVEIHPNAQIGGQFAIDHGHGTVIGQTTIIGKRNFIYHGVTLGATGRQAADGRRHPKLGNDIFLGNGAQILGPSIIGDDVQIASEAMILDAILGDKVKISPSVLVVRVEVPAGYQIFAFDVQNQAFIGRKAGETKTTTFVLPKVDISKKKSK